MVAKILPFVVFGHFQLQPSIILNLITSTDILMESWKGTNALYRLCLDEGKKICGGGNQHRYMCRHCQPSRKSLVSCSWYPDIETVPFFSLSALIRLLSADNAETNSAGCTLTLSESTKALKFTHAHSQRSKCGGEILSFTEMFRWQNSLCGTLLTETQASWFWYATYTYRLKITVQRHVHTHIHI